MRPRATPEASPDIRKWPFPASVDPIATPPAIVDPARFIASLCDSLAAITGLPVTIVCDAAATAPLPSEGFVRADGMRIALAVPAGLVGAVLSLRCGGAFAPSAAGGVGGASLTIEITAAILAAADAAWPGDGEWQPGACGLSTQGFTLRVSVSGFDFALPCAVTPTVSSPPVADTRDWSRRLRLALDSAPFAVRAVLHDRMVPLRDALAIRVGDILPIETSRDVSLRLGDRALARGTIVPDDDGGHRVAIVAVGATGITLAEKEPL